MRSHLNVSMAIAMSILILNTWSCRAKRSVEDPEKVKESPQEGRSDQADAGIAKDKEKETAQPEEKVEPAPFTVAGAIAKTAWVVEAQPRAYTGFDGVNAYKIKLYPSVLPDFTEDHTDEQLEQIFASEEFSNAEKGFEANVVMELLDPTAGTLKAPSVGNPGYEFTPSRAGIFLAKVKAGTAKEASVMIIATAYNPIDIAAARTRYNTSGTPADTNTASCASCHQVAGGVDHSPARLSGFPDAGILSTIETGINTDDGYRTRTPHTKTLSAAERLGMVGYLRTLPLVATPPAGGM